MRISRKVVMNVVGVSALAIIGAGLSLHSPWLYVPGFVIMTFSPFSQNSTN